MTVGTAPRGPSRQLRLRAATLPTATSPAGLLSWASPNPARGLPAPIRYINEVKIGVLANDIAFLGRHVEAGTDVNLETLVRLACTCCRVIGSPRADIGMTSTRPGNTQRGYSGLTWGVTLIHGLLRPDDGIFLNGSLGGADQDGYIQQRRAPPQGAGFAGAVP